MKWKRSRKAKEQATASTQSETERLRSSGKTSSDKSDESKRAVNPDDRRLELDLEDGEEDEEGEEEEEEEEAEARQRGFPLSVGNRVGMPQSTDFLQRSNEVGYSSHSSFSDDELDGMQVGGGDRKTGAGLWKYTQKKTLTWWLPECYRWHQETWVSEKVQA